MTGSDAWAKGCVVDEHNASNDGLALHWSAPKLRAGTRACGLDLTSYNFRRTFRAALDTSLLAGTTPHTMRSTVAS